MTSPQVLDLTQKGQLCPQYLVVYNQIAVEIRQDFTDYIQQASDKFKKDMDWWVSTPPSRNLYSSQLFHYCCCLVLIEQILETKTCIKTIYTDSIAFKNILKKKFKNHGQRINVIISRQYQKSGIQIFKAIFNIFFKVPFLHFCLHFAAQLTAKYTRQSFSEKKMILVDSFIVGKDLNDRYYPGLWENLREDEKKRVQFVPTFLEPPINSFLLYYKLRRTEKNFLIKEDFLTLPDYMYAWFHWLRLLKLRPQPSCFYKIDLSCLIREELVSFKGYYNAFLGLLNFCFVKRLKGAGIEVGLCIDWFENQSQDKGLNKGLNEFFPGCYKKGYQGFIITPHYMCLRPSQIEKRLGLIPDEICVMGEELISAINEFCPKQDLIQVTTAPAFRFSHIWDERIGSPGKNEFTVLVALPILLDEGDAILKMVSEILHNQHKSSSRFLIKPHPTNQEEDIRKVFKKKWPIEFEFVNGRFNHWVERSHLVISSGSTTSAMDAMARGVPAIIVYGQKGLMHNPIPDSISNQIWRLCQTPAELEEAVNHFKGKSQSMKEHYRKIEKSIKEDFFEPVNRGSVKKFLNL